jgi:hypothetical protein
MGGIFSTSSNPESSDLEPSAESVERSEDEEIDVGPKNLGIDIVELDHLSMKYKLAGDEEVLDILNQPAAFTSDDYMWTGCSSRRCEFDAG